MAGDAFLCTMLQVVLACDADVAAAFLASGRVATVEKRAHLVHQGERLDTIWLVLEGAAKIESISASGRANRLALCNPGDWMGHYAGPAAYLADIIALEPSTLLAFPAGILPRLAAGHAGIGSTLALSFARQLETTTAKLDARSTLTAKGRIYFELLRRADGGLEIVPPPVVAELAHAAQTTRETASRAIAELERRGIVTRGPAMLRIESRRLLSDLVV